MRDLRIVLAAQRRQNLPTFVLMGTISPGQIELVRESWSVLEPQAARFVDVLYEELFSAEPQLRILFEGPMDEQHIKVADAITFAIGHLHDPPALQDELRRLGERHKDYGVKAYHFEAMERTFDRSLERMLGEGYTAETREAWAAFVHLLTSGMQSRNGAAGV